MSATSRHIEVIYCDDIREEVGSKFSYMGVYSREMTVPSVPLVLAKFCIAIKVKTALADPFTFLEVRLVKFKGNEETELISTGSIPTPKVEEMLQQENGTTITLDMSFVLTPFQIDEEGIIRIIAKTEREELRSTGLHIRVVPSQAISAIE